MSNANDLMLQAAAVGVNGLAGFNGGTSLSGASWLNNQSKVGGHLFIPERRLILTARATPRASHDGSRQCKDPLRLREVQILW